MSFSERHPVLAIVGGVLLAIVIVTAVSWAIMGNDFFLYKFFAPKQAAVERQVFEQSPSFNKGMVQNLTNEQFDYLKEKDPNAKKAMRDSILHEVSGYNLNDPDVSSDLRSFIDQLQQDKINNP
jgi:hypothetical protein